MSPVDSSVDGLYTFYAVEIAEKNKQKRRMFFFVVRSKDMRIKVCWMYQLPAVVDIKGIVCLYSQHTQQAKDNFQKYNAKAYAEGDV